MTESRGAAVRRALDGALTACEAAHRRRGVAVPEDLAARIAALRRLMAVGRLPRVAAVGRRGAGKSSLANGLVGGPVLGVGAVSDRTAQATWRTLSLGGQRVDWLDTPGLRAGGRGVVRRDDVARAVAALPPDVLLVLCQATEVDAGIDQDVEDAVALAATLREETGQMPAVVGIVTKVDELDPVDVTDPPFDDVTKQTHIRTAVSVLTGHLARGGLRPVQVVPVAAYATWRHGGVDHDGRWNLDRLGAVVQGLLPTVSVLRGKALQDELARALRGLGDAVTAAFADLAYHAGAQGGATADADLASLEVALGTTLGVLGTPPDMAGATPGEILAARPVRGVTDVVRQGLLGLGARRASGWLAAARVRALGRALKALESVELDGATARDVIPG